MSSGTSHPGRVAKDVFRALQALARAEYGGNTGAVLVVYTVEGFLRRLAASKYATKLTLKGGMLLAAMSARRMTRDADLSAAGLSNDEATVAGVVAEIAETQLAMDDGLQFDSGSIGTKVIREHAEYHGIRAKLIAHLGTARVTATLDFSFGDLSRSRVVELPELLGNGTIRLASYPPELSLAEKVATMMSRRELNTRDRDFADVWALSRAYGFSAAELRTAIAEVAAARGHDVVRLVAALADMPDRQQTYSAALARMAYQRRPPASWTALVGDVVDFIDPVIEDTDGKLIAWDPVAQQWTGKDITARSPAM